ncbi:MAG: radical SAM protein [bacterium]|jgi:DNA repair photolyase|nr:radical SAM protein [bacterium]
MIQEIQCKSILQKSRLPESPYCLNPYVGCSHRCAYCYARFMRRFTGHHEDRWGQFVDVKVNADTVLANQLQRRRIDGPVLLGSVCDAYQPIEKKYGLTRRCIQSLVNYKIPFSVLTKSSLVVRDIDLLKKLPSISVGISLSMRDDAARRIVEPGASTIEERLETLKVLHAQGIKTYVFIGPILPEITCIEEIMTAVRDVSDEIWGEALNLRCGNREDLIQAYAKLGIPTEWQTLAKSQKYWNSMSQTFEQAAHRYKLPLIGFYKH